MHDVSALIVYKRQQLTELSPVRVRVERADHGEVEMTIRLPFGELAEELVLTLPAELIAQVLLDR